MDRSRSDAQGSGGYPGSAGIEAGRASEPPPSPHRLGARPADSSQPTFLHELTDERARAPEARAEAAAPPSEDVNVFDAWARVEAPAPAEASAPPATRVVEGCSAAVESIVIPALTTLAERGRQVGWRPLALVAAGAAVVALVVLVGSSLTGSAEKRAPRAAALDLRPDGAPVRIAATGAASAHGAATDAAVEKRAADHLRAARHAKAGATLADKVTRRRERLHDRERRQARERPTRRDGRRRPRPAPSRTPVAPPSQAAPPSPPMEVAAPAPAPAPRGGPDEFGFEG